MKVSQIPLYVLTFAATLMGCMESQSTSVVPDEQSQSEVYFLQLKEANAGQMEAQLRGKLVLTEGCLRIQIGENKEDAYTTIWPFEFALNVQSGSVSILNGEGHVVASVGDEVLVSGGELPFLSRQEFLDNFSGPYLCPNPYWLVGYETEVLTP